MGQSKQGSTSVWACILVLFSTSVFLPLASASTGGASIDVSSISLADMYGFSGDELTFEFNISEGDGFDANVEVFVNASNLEGGLLNSTSQNLTIIANSAINHQVSLNDLPYGYSIIEVELNGDVSSTLDTRFNRTVQRLSPASLQVSNIDYQAVDLNGDWTGNSTGSWGSELRSGDYLNISVPLENVGDLLFTTNVNMTLSHGDYSENFSFQNIDVAGQSTVYLYAEPTSQVVETTTESYSLDLTFEQWTGSVPHQISSNFQVGPEPLARMNMQISLDTVDLVAGETVEWSLELVNDGEADYSGSLQCEFEGQSIHDQAISISSNSNSSYTISTTARPGTVTCSLDGQRIWHDSSATTFHSIYVESAQFESAGSATPAMLNGPWHQGDSVDFSILSRNYGDATGNAFLSISYDGDTWDSIPLQLDPDQAGELRVSVPLIQQGLHTFQWAVLSNDGGVDQGMSGELELFVAQRQSVAIEITQVTWDATDGVSLEYSLELDAGVSRDVRLRIGWQAGGSETYTYDNVVTLQEGLHENSYNFGLIEAEKVVVRIDAENWSIGSGPDAAFNSIPDDRPRLFAELDPLSNPRDPVALDEVTIKAKLSNSGSEDSVSGSVVLIDETSNILAQKNVNAVLAGEDETVDLDIVWPAGESVKLRLIWYVAGEEYEASNSYQSGVQEIEEESMRIPWVAILGGIGGAVAIILFMRLKNSPQRLEKVQAKQQVKKEKASKSSSGEVKKVQVSCPECARQLRVPSTYSGKVGCPDCATKFEVTAREKPVEQKASQPVSETPAAQPAASPAKAKDEPKLKAGHRAVSCPECSGTLSVPEDYGGSVRCSSCKTVFKAE